ncbi:MAG: hypothetical protein VX992_07805, partial [Acidobacteriota bacterium]|nr:hypothetical protein [Acidobacteriota bacterium]
DAARLGALLCWLAAHRAPSVDVELVPDTGCAAADYAERALWLGRRGPHNPAALSAAASPALRLQAETALLTQLTAHRVPLRFGYIPIVIVRKLNASKLPAGGPSPPPAAAAGTTSGAAGGAAGGGGGGGGGGGADGAAAAPYAVLAECFRQANCCLVRASSGGGGEADERKT